MKILIIEDTSSLHKKMTAALVAAGHIVNVISDFADAKQVKDKLDENSKASVVLLDHDIGQTYTGKGLVKFLPDSCILIGTSTHEGQDYCTRKWEDKLDLMDPDRRPTAEESLLKIITG